MSELREALSDPSLALCPDGRQCKLYQGNAPRHAVSLHNAMQFKISSRDNGKVTAASWHDLKDMQAELAGLARVLDALVPGQVIEITRIS